MKIKNLIILTNSLNRFPQRLSEIESIDVERMAKFLSENNIDTRILKYSNLINDLDLIESLIKDGSAFLLSSSQKRDYYEYIENIATFLDGRGANLIPSKDLLKCHDNKFYQELYLRGKGVPTPKSLLIGTVEEVDEVCKDAVFPKVVKTACGFASRGVARADSVEEIKEFAKATFQPSVAPRKNIYQRWKTKCLYSGKYPEYVGRLVVQDFIPDLLHDWKVIVLGNKVFALKRYIRKNDFRASGSGNFDFSESPSEKLLSFAMDVKNVLGTPWVSLDIAEIGDNFSLIEYQAVHFGPYTVIGSDHHFLFSDGSWEKIYKKVDYEEELCHALIGFEV